MNNFLSKLKRKNILFAVLFIVAFLERTVFDLGANVELITTVMILASFYLGQKKALFLTLLLLITTDRVKGNTDIFLFTWSGFLIPALLVNPIFKKFSVFLKLKQKLISTLSFSVASNLFFFTWTNLGVWLLDSWGMYPKTASGLLSCYVNALPFLKPQIVSSLLFVPLGVMLIELSNELFLHFKISNFKYSR